jgi:hypothetical protein
MFGVPYDMTGFALYGLCAAQTILTATAPRSALITGAGEIHHVTLQGGTTTVEANAPMLLERVIIEQSGIEGLIVRSATVSGMGVVIRPVPGAVAVIGGALHLAQSVVEGSGSRGIEVTAATLRLDQVLIRDTAPGFNFLGQAILLGQDALLIASQVDLAGNGIGLQTVHPSARAIIRDSVVREGRVPGYGIRVDDGALDLASTAIVQNGSGGLVVSVQGSAHAQQVLIQDNNRARTMAGALQVDQQGQCTLTSSWIDANLGIELFAIDSGSLELDDVIVRGSAVDTTGYVAIVIGGASLAARRVWVESGSPNGIWINTPPDASQVSTASIEDLRVDHMKGSSALTVTDSVVTATRAAFIGTSFPNGSHLGAFAQIGSRVHLSDVRIEGTTGTSSYSLLLQRDEANVMAHDRPTLVAERIELVGNEGLDLLLKGWSGGPQPYARIQDLKIGGRPDSNRSDAIYVECGALDLFRADVSVRPLLSKTTLETSFLDGIRAKAAEVTVRDIVVTTSSNGKGLHAVLRDKDEPAPCPETSIDARAFRVTSGIEPICAGSSNFCVPGSGATSAHHGEVSSTMAGCNLWLPRGHRIDTALCLQRRSPPFSCSSSRRRLLGPTLQQGDWRSSPPSSAHGRISRPPKRCSHESDTPLCSGSGFNRRAMPSFTWIPRTRW